MDVARLGVGSPPRRCRWLWRPPALALALALVKTAVPCLRRDRIGRVIVVVVDAVVAAQDSRRRTLSVEVEIVVDNRSLLLLVAALDSQSIGPAIVIAIEGSLWRAG